jgi:hypothetical protein
VGETKYALQQFHFHRPSEEKINGKGYEMEVHLVHADQEGKLAQFYSGRGKITLWCTNYGTTCPRKKKKKNRWMLSGSMQLDYCPPIAVITPFLGPSPRRLAVRMSRGSCSNIR